MTWSSSVGSVHPAQHNTSQDEPAFERDIWFMSRIDHHEPGLGNPTYEDEQAFQTAILGRGMEEVYEKGGYGLCNL